ncbi:hypothetical protein [Candidatus Methylobacter favarea]|uniref:hypothetical protein n=1 Tax=Candidatus Methylobacter favarea TaxID=2707345 RepID=UPI001C2CE43E|nr:hypothetical protein [Candidatus Methylobacter favarea]
MLLVQSILSHTDPLWGGADSYLYYSTSSPSELRTCRDTFLRRIEGEPMNPWFNAALITPTVSPVIVGYIRLHMTERSRCHFFHYFWQLFWLPWLLFLLLRYTTINIGTNTDFGFKPLFCLAGSACEEDASPGRGNILPPKLLTPYLKGSIMKSVSIDGISAVLLDLLLIRSQLQAVTGFGSLKERFMMTSVYLISSTCIF